MQEVYNTTSTSTQSAISGESPSDTSRNLARDIVVGAASNLEIKTPVSLCNT